MKHGRPGLALPARWSAAIVAALLMACGGVAMATAAGTVFTADEAGGTISMIDLASGRVDQRAIAVLPHNVQVSSDGRLVLAVGMRLGAGAAGPGQQRQKGHQAHRGNGVLVVLEASAGALQTVAEIPLGRHPAHVVADRAGALAFVTDSQEDAVLVVDLAARRVAGRIATGAYPHGLRLSPDERELYVANMKGGSVSVIDVASRAEVARIAVGKAPVQVGFTPDGGRLFVSLHAEAKVAAIDPRTRRLIGKAATGRNPVQVYATPDGRHLYVANQGTAKDPDNTVSVIAVDGLQTVATITAAEGDRPALRHLMSKNFSAPRSAPKPASVTT